MLHIHKWKKDSTNCRTCLKCKKHQVHAYTWEMVSCKVYDYMLLRDMGKEMRKVEEDICEYHTQNPI